MEENKQTLYNDELLDILPDGVIIFNISGEVIQLNRQALTELHVHSSVNAMMPLPTNILFKLLNNKEDILSVILEKIRQGEQTYSLSEHISCKNRWIIHNSRSEVILQRSRKMAI